MDINRLKDILIQVKHGDINIDTALEYLKHLPYEDIKAKDEDIPFACIDHHRELRCGFPEVVFGAGKSIDEITMIVNSIIKKGNNIIITRVDKDVYQKLYNLNDKLVYHEQARMITLKQSQPVDIDTYVLVITGGTSDIPVAEEAAITVEMFGICVQRLYDVGVAGIHRLLDKAKKLYNAAVIITVAGMEGALPSVVSGLVDVPVIAVPTSVGYGANFRGLSALLTMLNSCAPGIAVVNIDNGFGAGYFAGMLIMMMNKKSKSE
jgi:hypothetical protein